MNRAIVLFLFMSWSFICFSQANGSFISGIIRDSETKALVQFASIGITGSMRGTAANDKGEFTLKIKPEDLKQKLKISSIGFITSDIAIDSLLEVDQVVIELQSQSNLLNEVVVEQAPINPVEIVRSAIDSTVVNYMLEPFNLEFYSAIQASDVVTNQNFKVESIILGYYKGYATSAEKKFEILKKRMMGDNPLESMDYTFWPTLEIHRADLIADPAKTGILNVKNLDKFEYKYIGSSVYEADTVYQIDYHAPKPSEKITGYGVVPKVYKGTIYITTNSNAIVRHDVDTDQFSYSIIYKKIQEKYFPYFISGERRFKGTNMFTTLVNTVMLVNIRLDNVTVINYRTNEFQQITDLPDDEEYWDLNFPETKK